MKILVTGGAGYIGSHTVVELVKNGYEPIIIDDFSNSDKSVLKSLSDICGVDIENYESSYSDVTTLDKIFANEHIEGVIHFAAYKSVADSVKYPLKYYENNVGGLITLLKKIDEYKIPNFVFSSSCTVYGEPESLPVTEKSEIKRASSPYGTTKQMGEKITQDLTKSSETLKTAILRYFNPIGAHSSSKIGELPLGAPSNLVPLVTQTVAGLRDKIIIFGDNYPTIDGTCVRDYVHVEDLANAHVMALKKLIIETPSYCDEFNIGTGVGTSVKQIIQAFEKVTGEKVPYIVGDRRPGDITATYASVDKANKDLKWIATKTVDDALLDAWKWQEALTNK